MLVDTLLNELDFVGAAGRYEHYWMQAISSMSVYLADVKGLHAPPPSLTPGLAADSHPNGPVGSPDAKGASLYCHQNRNRDVFEHYATGLELLQEHYECYLVPSLDEWFQFGPLFAALPAAAPKGNRHANRLAVAVGYLNARDHLLSRFCGRKSPQWGPHAHWKGSRTTGTAPLPRRLDVAIHARFGDLLHGAEDLGRWRDDAYNSRLQVSLLGLVSALKLVGELQHTLRQRTTSAGGDRTAPNSEIPNSGNGAEIHVVLVSDSPIDVIAAIPGLKTAGVTIKIVAGSTSVPAGSTSVLAGSTSVPAGSTSVPAGSTSVPAGLFSSSQPHNTSSAANVPALPMAVATGHGLPTAGVPFHVVDGGNPLIGLHCLAAANLLVAARSSFAEFAGLLSAGTVVKPLNANGRHKPQRGAPSTENSVSLNRKIVATFLDAWLESDRARLQKAAAAAAKERIKGTWRRST
jgi:hypothetical protein